MFDKKVIRDDRAQHEPHPVGQYVAVCVDFIDVGPTVMQFPPDPPQIKDTVALVFRTNAKPHGKPLHIWQEFTASMGRNAKFRKLLEAWRGRPYTNTEAREVGFNPGEFEGVGALLTVAHRESKTGNTYAVIGSIQPLPAKMAEDLPSPTGYVRALFWDKKKRENEAKVLAFQPQPRDDSEAPPAEDDEDDGPLPF